MIRGYTYMFRAFIQLRFNHLGVFLLFSTELPRLAGKSIKLGFLTLQKWFEGLVDSLFYLSTRLNQVARWSQSPAHFCWGQRVNNRVGCAALDFLKGQSVSYDTYQDVKLGWACSHVYRICEQFQLSMHSKQGNKLFLTNNLIHFMQFTMICKIVLINLNELLTNKSQ